MKSTLSLFALFISLMALSQTDSLNRVSYERDSMKVVMPEVVDASLSMLTPPEGFEVSTAFNGYISLGMSSAIIMTLIDHVNFEKLKEGMTAEYFERNKLTLINEEEFKTETGHKGISYKLSFILNDTDFVRYLVYVSEGDKTLWLNITYPKMVEDFVEIGIIRSIQTVNLNESRGDE